MTRNYGPEFAEDMSQNKEEIDLVYYELAETMSDDCWELLPEWVQDWIAGSACSAYQPSDFEDNAAGRKCGMEKCLQDLSCEDCCTKLGRGPNTPEGRPGAKRDYGPYCTERYRDEL